MLKEKSKKEINFDTLETAGREKTAEINSKNLGQGLEGKISDVIFVNRIPCEWHLEKLQKALLKKGVCKWQ